MHSCCEGSVEQWEKDLANAGWIRRAGNIYQTPWDAYYRGPHKAWHIWHGGEEEWNRIVAERDGG